MSFNEKRSYTEYNVTASTSVFAIGFDDYNLVSKDRIVVTIDGVEATEAGYTVTRSSPSTLTLNPAVVSGVVRLTRETNIDETFNKFTAGSLFTPKNVNDNFEQILRSQQEVEDRQSKLEGDVLPVVAGLEDALAAAETASQAAEDAAASAEFFGSNYGKGIRPLWKDELKPYAQWAEVRLDNGDIVRNIVPNNINNPNIDMVGWVNKNNHNSLLGRDMEASHPASAILDASGENQQTLNLKFSKKLNDFISLKDFGAIGDGVTDDTSAVQAFVDYICSNHVHGFAPKGVYKLTSKINFTGTYGWGIIGSGSEATIFKQFTNNTPIFDLGAISGPGMHSYLLSDFKLDYNTSQPPSNTDSNPIRFSQMGYEGELNRITFARGSWAIKVVSGVGGPWGQHWDNLNFGGQLTGGAMDWTGAVNAVPNNYWGRFLVTCSNMIGPIFRNIRGYNWVWNALEMLDGKNVQWISMQAGSQCLLNSLKMELCTYSGEPAFDGNALMYFPSGQIDIGQLNIGGTYAKFEFTSGRVLFSVSSGSLTVKMLSTALTVLPTNFYMFSAISGNSEVNYRAKGSYPIEYTNVGGSTAAEYLNIIPDKNDKLSSNKGDADYTVLNGDPSQIRFETLLTAPRTVNLPSGNNCFNGLRYRIISSGAVNSTNTLSIKASGNTKATLTLDKTFVDLEWRRNAVAHLGWVVIGSGSIP